MFIRKWRYLQNLENARIEGIREGKRVANEQKFAYIEYLEEENKALKEKLEAIAAADIAACASQCNEITDCCPEVSDITDDRENCCAVQETSDEEAPF